MRARRVLVISICIVSLLTLLACGFSLGGKKATETPASKPVATNTAASVAPTKAQSGQPTATKATTSESVATATPKAEATSAESDTLPELSVSLEGVDSYSAVMEISMREKDASEDKTQSFKILEERDVQKSAQRLVMDGIGEDGKPFKMEMIQIGKDSYISMGEGWMHVKSDEAESMTGMADSFLGQGNEFLSDVKEAKLVKRGEEVNGIKTDHYSWKDVTIDNSGATGKTTGDAWIAQDTKYIIKLTMDIEGNVIDTDKNSIVKMTWEVLSLNKPVEINPPEEMSAENMLPIMEGAEESENYVVSTDMAMYDIKSTVKDAMSFYETTLTDAGYTKDNEDISDDLGSATYKKDGETVSVMVTKSDDKEGFVGVIVTREKE